MRVGKKWATVLAGGALAATVAATAATSSFAQEPTTPTPAPTTPEATTPSERSFGRGFGHHGFGGRFGNQDEFLAEELGITVEELEAARQAARTRAIDQAVQDGLLTQEQADAIKSREALAAYIDREAIVADALGMTVAELEAAEAAGQRLPEIIEAQGLDAAAFRDALQQAYEDAVQQAVADGVITQEQADQFLSGAEGFGLRGFGGRGFRGPRGGDFWAEPAPATPESGA